ncbi:MAG: hypothetical protein M3134_01225, partial [Actinomycetota bacterium]|nr:hypothetical protein [Actinomycetota bacterium]
TTSHAIAGPGARIGLPPLPLSLDQVPTAVPLPQPFTPGGAFTRSELTLSCPPASQDGVVAVSGTLAPAADRTIRLTYQGPDGTQLIRTVGTNADGTYGDRIEGAATGEWTVHASWRGDPFRQPAAATPCTTKVSPPPPPDLVVAELTPEGVTVRNQGNGAAGEFDVTVTQGDGKYSETFTIPGLGPGESARRDTTCQGGVVRAVADSTQRVAESDENNNEAVTQYGCPP